MKSGPSRRPMTGSSSLSSLQIKPGEASASDHPERYRGNLLIDGLDPFEELTWVGKTLQIGSATFEVIEPIVRCRATECDWHGSRTDGFLDRLDQSLDTDVCGLFLRAVGDGEVKIADQLTVLS
jgi:uncharacterized protein YcbX